MKNGQLRGAVYGAYPSIAAFAKAIKWDRKKASRIINGHQQLTANDIEEIATLLKIEDAKVFVDIFFNGLSTTRTEPPKPKPIIDPMSFIVRRP